MFVFSLVTPKVNDVLKLPASKNILIVGDSYTACAINDSLFSRSINLSFVAEAYMYSYFKLRKLLPLNPQIDTVFLGFSSISVNEYTDIWYTESGPISKRLPAHSQLMNVKELGDIFTMNPNGFVNAFISDYKENIQNYVKMKKVTSLSEMEFGSYVFSDKMISNEILLEGEEMERSMSLNYSVKQLNYVRKIANVCAKNNVKLVLFVTPIHSAAPKNLQRVFYQLYEDRFSDIDMIDYSRFVLPDSCFGDLHHLNYKGARVFSNYLETQ